MKHLFFLLQMAALLTISIVLLAGCRVQKEVVHDTTDTKHSSVIVKHDTIRVERHRVDSIYRHDSIFVSQSVRNDTVYVDRHFYHTYYQRESETKKDSVKVVEEEKEEDAEIVVKKEEKVKKPLFMDFGIVAGFVILTLLVIYILKKYK